MTDLILPTVTLQGGNITQTPVAVEGEQGTAELIENNSFFNLLITESLLNPGANELPQEGAKLLALLKKDLNIDLEQDTIDVNAAAAITPYLFPQDALETSANLTPESALPMTLSILQQVGVNLTPEAAKLASQAPNVLGAKMLKIELPEGITQLSAALKESVEHEKLFSDKLTNQNTGFTAEDFSKLFRQKFILPDNVPSVPNSSSYLNNQSITQFNQILQAAGLHHQTAATELPVAVSHPNWGDALGERMMWLANQKVQTAAIHLNPPELGPLDVRIRVSNDQTNLVFSSAHAPVRDALEQALPKLREMFSSTGLQLGDVNVSGHSLRENAQGGATSDNLAYQERRSFLLENEIEDEMIAPISSSTIKSLSLIDYYV